MEGIDPQDDHATGDAGRGAPSCWGGTGEDDAVDIYKYM